MLQEAMGRLADAQPYRIKGSVVTVRGLTLLVENLPVSLGSTVTVEPEDEIIHQRRGEVIGFHQDAHIIMLYDAESGLYLNTNEGAKPGTRLTLRVEFPDGMFTLRGEVVWAIQAPEHPNTGMPRRMDS